MHEGAPEGLCRLKGQTIPGSDLEFTVGSNVATLFDTLGSRHLVLRNLFPAAPGMAREPVAAQEREELRVHRCCDPACGPGCDLSSARRGADRGHFFAAVNTAERRYPGGGTLRNIRCDLTRGRCQQTMLCISPEGSGYQYFTDRNYKYGLITGTGKILRPAGVDLPWGAMMVIVFGDAGTEKRSASGWCDRLGPAAV
jgi:hypothetical protein